MLLLALAFVVVPLVEIYVIIQVGQAIGALWTIGLLIASSLAGARLLRWQGGRAWRSFQRAIAAGEVPHREVLDGALIIAGGALLLTPGFVTDLLGMALLIPISRAAVRRFALGLLVRRRVAGWARVVVRSRPAPDGGPAGPAPPPGPSRRLPPG